MRAQFQSKIATYLKRGESVQVVAPSGFGKSRFGRSVGGLYLDTNLLQSPTELLSALKSSTETHTIVLDALSSILNSSYTPVFAYLKALRDQHKGQLAYVFLVNRLVDPSYQPLMGDLYELATEHVEYLPPLDESDLRDFSIPDFTPTPSQITQVLKLSGGIPALVKICYMALRDNTSLDPAANPKLAAQIAELLHDAPNHPAFTSTSLLSHQAPNPSKPILTAAETRFLQLFQSQLGQIVSKDQICRVVYPDVKNYSGVSDHAIDQLVHRLRSKLDSSSHLLTHRGLGYQLTHN